MSNNYSVEIDFDTPEEYLTIIGELGMRRVVWPESPDGTQHIVKIYFKTLSEIMPYINGILKKLGRPLGYYNVWDEANKCWQRKIKPDSNSEEEEPAGFVAAVRKMDEIEVTIQEFRNAISVLKRKMDKIKHMDNRIMGLLQEFRNAISVLEKKITRLETKQEKIITDAQNNRVKRYTNSELHR